MTEAGISYARVVSFRRRLEQCRSLSAAEIEELFDEIERLRDELDHYRKYGDNLLAEKKRWEEGADALIKLESYLRTEETKLRAELDRLRVVEAELRACLVEAVAINDEQEKDLDRPGLHERAYRWLERARALVRSTASAKGDR